MAKTLDERSSTAVVQDEDGKRRARHVFAIVDEVDNILIDEARTPLIISGAPSRRQPHSRFARLAPMMEAGEKPNGLDPRAKKEFTADYDFEFDEKHKTVSITERGVAKAEKFLGIDHLYRAENGHLVNHLQQALKAEALYKRDVDYAVVDDEVKIIDEFTGRILDGRRWSEGLHQAVEAKEAVRVQEENQTLATITLQNYFRLYEKLAGMTGTALTEATEFKRIYDLDVVEIPTNRPMVRDDRNDQVYKTRDGKWSAVAAEIAKRNENGQPVLVGTISVEVSELLSEKLKARGIKHWVLNAKPEHAEREGDTVAEAGRKGAVTIATNMAGRGVDIKLGGNPEHLARLELAKLGLTPGDPDYEETFAQVLPKMEEQVEAERDQVTAAGGLFICGTERHESRRIDNQLRGRSGRQGDPGESRFFLSGEDDLVRLFAGDRIYNILDRFGTEDEEGNEEPIEHKMLTRQIEKAQKKVEDQNFLIRKRVLEYDDVMNEQRKKVYEYRDGILEGRDMGEPAREEIGAMIERVVEEYTPGDYIEEWDLDGLFDAARDIWPTEQSVADVDADSVDRDGLVTLLSDDAGRLYEAREEELSTELMRELERYLLLEIIDQRWREHLYDMDYLREGIHLRGFAQIEPIVAYKNEAFETLPRPHADDLVGLRADDLQRRGRGAAGERRAPDLLAALLLLDDGRQRLLLRPRAGRVGRAGDGGRGRARRAGRRGLRGRKPRRRRAPSRPGRAARARRERADRPQRPLLVRERQEVQEVPWRLTARRHRLAGRAHHPAGREGPWPAARRSAQSRGPELPTHRRARGRAYRRGRDGPRPQPTVRDDGGGGLAGPRDARRGIRSRPRRRPGPAQRGRRPRRVGRSRPRGVDRPRRRGLRAGGQ